MIGMMLRGLEVDIDNDIDMRRVLVWGGFFHG